MILLVWDVRNAATCLGFFLSLLIRTDTDTDTDTDTSSCFIWVLLNFYFFFDICHVVNIKFIGWYIMYFCYPVFFFLQKFTTWHIDHHPILFFLFNSKQNTEAKTQQNYHTHRGDDWRLTTVLLKTMAGVGRQFILLLWKNWLLQKRKACVTVFEIVMPIVFAVILVCIRLIAKNETISQSTIWPPFKPNDVMLRGSQIEILYSPNTTDIQTMMNTFRNFLPGLGIT